MEDKKYDTSDTDTKSIGKTVDELDQMFSSQRKGFERRWYDNMFFDDGRHYRFVSRITGKIMDLESNSKIFLPKRSIPKASRQIRGIANVLMSLNPVPVVYPEKVTEVNYQDPKEYQVALLESKMVARRVGHWLREEWLHQEMETKLALMVLLGQKMPVSFMQIWPDPNEEKIMTQVYDAFDIKLKGNLHDINYSPAIIKTTPRIVKDIKIDPRFDEKQKELISPDNRMASNELKEAYIQATHGDSGGKHEASVTVIEKEAFIKEFINEKNWKKVVKDLGDTGFMEGKSKGDKIIRQVFAAGGVWLRDNYVALNEYPFVDFRMEPGPIYQTAQIERFIPQNKSLDAVVSRIETLIHTLTVGIYQKRKGENFRIDNRSGAQIIEYAQTPLTQMQMTSVPGQLFGFIYLLEQYIEEQGVTTTASGKLPKGVKAHAAIESLKSSELTNMGISIKMLKQTVQRISQRFLDIADQNFISPQTVMRLEKNEPDYFDVMGSYGIKLRKKIGDMQAVKGVVPLSKDYRVDIQIESGMAFTEMGRKETMMELSKFLIELANNKWLPPEGVKEVIRGVLETFKFGNMSDIMASIDQMESAGPVGPEEGSTERKAEIKMAILEVFRDLQKGGSGAAQQQPAPTAAPTRV